MYMPISFFFVHQIMMTMITKKEYLRFMSAHVPKESNSCMEQSVTFRTNKVRRDASGWVIVDSVLVKLSFILGFLDSIWLRRNSTIHNDVPPDVSFLSQDFPVIHFNVEPFQWCFKCVLEAFLINQAGVKNVSYSILYNGEREKR